MEIDYQISFIGYETLTSSGVHRTDLEEIYLGPDNKQTLLTENQFRISPDSQIPFKVKYKSSTQHFEEFVRKEMKKNYDEVIPGSTVLLKKIKYYLEISFLNPQTNKPEKSSEAFETDNPSIGFTLSFD